MRIPQNKRGLIVNKEYSRLPYMTDEGYDEIQRSTSQKFVQDNYGKFDESENQQSYKVDSEYDDGYQGLEYDYSLPGFNSGLGNIDIDPAEATDKDISCDEYWNQLFPGHPTGNGPFIPTGADLSALNIYSKKCPVEFKFHICCGRGLKVQGPVNGELESEQNFKFDVGNKPKDCEYNFWANKGWMWSDGRYTAPTVTEETTDTLGIYPWTGISGTGETNCLTWKVKIKPKTGVCLGRVTVTAPTMVAGSSQTLTVQGWVAGEVYSWSTTTGSLDVATGNSAVYTAPASNANCTSNPTISLTCGGNVVDTVKIAVNGSGDTTNPAYRQAVGFSEFRCYYESSTCKWMCAFAASFYYNCAGTFLSVYSSGVGYSPSYNCGAGGGMGVGGACNAYPGVDCCSPTSTWCEARKTQYCTTCSTAAEAAELLGGADLRTGTMKTAGCCPAALL